MGTVDLKFSAFRQAVASQMSNCRMVAIESICRNHSSLMARMILRIVEFYISAIFMAHRMLKLLTVIRRGFIGMWQELDNYQKKFACHFLAFVSLAAHVVVVIILLSSGHTKDGLNNDVSNRNKSTVYMVSYSHTDQHDLTARQKMMTENSPPLKKILGEPKNTHVVESDHEVAEGRKRILAFSITKPEPRYFVSKELTQMPVVIWDVPSDLALAASDVPAQSAKLHIFVNEYGDVDRVVVEDSTLSKPDQKKIVDAFGKSKFRPGQIGRIPVKSEVKVELTLEDLR
jgi:hypothetical protein